MPVVGVKPIDKTLYNLSINMGFNKFKSVIISPSGVYDIRYIKDGIYISAIGKVTKVVVDSCHSYNSYLLFDDSTDKCNHKERINLYKIQDVIDVTPSNSYQVAVDNGFEGTVHEWLESLKGKSAYQIAVDNGFTGTEEDWVVSLKAASNYQIAVNNGFTGTEKEWLNTLKALSNYQIAVNNGFTGTEQEWLNTLKAASNYDIAVENGFEGTREEWLCSLRGESAYDVAVNNGFTGTEEEWIESLKGLSAYEVAVKCGFEGTEEEWVASLGFTSVMENRIQELESGLRSAIDKLNEPIDHNKIINRDTPDQHTIKSVKGLRRTIDNIPNQIETIPNSELEELLK